MYVEENSVLHGAQGGWVWQEGPSQGFPARGSPEHPLECMAAIWPHGDRLCDLTVPTSSLGYPRKSSVQY